MANWSLSRIQGSMMTSSVQDALPQAFYGTTLTTQQCGEVKVSQATYWYPLIPTWTQESAEVSEGHFLWLHVPRGIKNFMESQQSKRIWHRKLVDTPRQIMSNNYLEFWWVCVGVCVLQPRKLGGLNSVRGAKAKFHITFSQMLSPSVHFFRCWHLNDPKPKHSIIQKHPSKSGQQYNLGQTLYTWETLNPCSTSSTAQVDPQSTCFGICVAKALHAWWAKSTRELSCQA